MITKQFKFGSSLLFRAEYKYIFIFILDVFIYPIFIYYTIESVMSVN